MDLPKVRRGRRVRPQVQCTPIRPQGTSGEQHLRPEGDPQPIATLEANAGPMASFATLVREPRCVQLVVRPRALLYALRGRRVHHRVFCSTLCSTPTSLCSTPTTRCTTPTTPGGAPSRVPGCPARNLRHMPALYEWPTFCLPLPVTYMAHRYG